jgi:hypothetical protein
MKIDRLLQEPLGRLHDFRPFSSKLYEIHAGSRYDRVKQYRVNS